jgi:hypothetical protein
MTSVERTYARAVRVKVPTRMLRPAMGSIDGLLRYFPGIETDPAQTADKHARCHVAISIGPLSYRLDAVLSIDEGDTPEMLRISMRVPALRLEIRGLFDFAASAAGETTLRYTATISSTHPLARRIPTSLANTLEDHVDSAIDLIAKQGRQYSAAKRLRARFGDRGDRAELDG